MTANAQTRYDFGRCTVEHVGPHDYNVPAWGTDSGHILGMSKRGIVVRVQQSHVVQGFDEAMFTLLDVDARDLANQILEALGDE